MFLPLFYHSISDQELPHTQYLFSTKTKAQFLADVDYLQTNFNTLSIEELANWPNVPENSFLLTFDDGGKELLWVAQTLAEREIQALFFVNKAFVLQEEIFFKHKASIICGELNEQKQLKKGLKKGLLSHNPISIELINEHWNTKPRDEAAFMATNYLDFEDINQIADMGHIIGGHSVNHPHFSFLTIEEALVQTLDSCQWVQVNFNPKLLTFAFPFEDYFLSKQFYAKLAESQFTPALTFGTSNGKEDVIPNNIQRIDAEKDKMSMEQRIPKHKRNRLARKLLNRNTVQRKDGP